MFTRGFELCPKSVSLGRLGRISTMLESTRCAQQSVLKRHGVIYPTCLNRGTKDDIRIQGQSSLPLITAAKTFSFVALLKTFFSTSVEDELFQNNIYLF